MGFETQKSFVLFRGVIDVYFYLLCIAERRAQMNRSRSKGALLESPSSREVKGYWNNFEIIFYTR